MAASTEFLFNPQQRDFNEDPYVHYRRLRESQPLHRNFMGIWVAADYQTVNSVLRDARFRSRDIPAQLDKKGRILDRLNSKQPAVQCSGSLDSLLRHARRWLPFIEAPDHTRLRKLVSKAFQQRAAESMRPLIRDRAQRILDARRNDGRMDLMMDFARVLPTQVIAATLGMPEEDLPALHHWVDTIARVLDPLLPLEEYVELDRASAGLIAYFTTLLSERRRNPQNDLLTALIHAREAQDALSEDEIIATCILLFGAGSETTSNLLATGMLTLLRHPDQLALLRSQPTRMADAVEELLRYEAPLQMTSRIALADVELCGQAIRRNEQVYLLIGSANRDPGRFHDPEKLDVRRQENPHLSFAAGPHFCLGAALARIEAQEGFKALLTSMPDLALATETVAWRAHTVLRGLKSLDVVWGRGGEP